MIPIVCRETVDELLRVLTYPKFRLNAEDREVLLADYLPFAEPTRLPNLLSELPLMCRDRGDTIFLQLAIANRADLLVSGDGDLAALAAAYPVATPAMLQQRLAQATCLALIVLAVAPGRAKKRINRTWIPIRARGTS